MRRHTKIERTAYTVGVVVGFGGVIVALPAALVWGPGAATQIMVAGFAVGILMIVLTMVTTGAVPTISAKE